MAGALAPGVAGILLTGGSSRRMGADKACLAAGLGETLSQRTARLLEAATVTTIEVGPGWSGLTPVGEPTPHQGPLSAAVQGSAALARAGWLGPVLLVATDLPRLTRRPASLAGHATRRRQRRTPRRRRSQPLCARYSRGDMEIARRLVAAGCRSMGELLDATRPSLAPEEEWVAAAGDPLALADTDTPEDLERLSRPGR